MSKEDRVSLEEVTIGQCRLIRGDCRTVVAALNAVDMVCTDPPYGHNNNNNNDLIHRWEAALGRGPVTQGDARPIANDGCEANDLVQWLFAESARLLPPGGICCCCCCGGGGPDPQFARWSLWMDALLGFKQAVVWDKMSMGMGWHYRRSYELVLVGEKPGAACKWYGNHSVKNLIQIPGIIPQASDHPTPKPVALFEHFIRLHTTLDDIVLDPFAGTFTSAIAAMRLGRRYIGIEIDPHWFQAGCRRIEAAYAQLDLYQPQTWQVPTQEVFAL